MIGPALFAAGKVIIDADADMRTALHSFKKQYEEAEIETKYVTLHAEEHIVPGSKATGKCMSKSRKHSLTEEQDSILVSKKPPKKVCRMSCVLYS